jgi:hypothetical protein
MSDVVLLLGPIVFSDFEVPAGITFGGMQRLAVHRLPGGGRVIDALGRDDAALTFSGIFTGTDATLRARALDELRAAGLPLPLTWDVFFYSVVIENFEADYRNDHWIPYCISCTVIRDEAAALVETGISLAASALADVSTAISSAAVGGIDLSAAQEAIGLPGATTSGTTAFSEAQSSLADARSTLGDGLDASGAALSSAGSAEAPTANAGIANLSQATEAAGQQSQFTLARSYLGRAAVNLTNAST